TPSVPKRCPNATPSSPVLHVPDNVLPPGSDPRAENVQSRPTSSASPGGLLASATEHGVGWRPRLSRGENIHTPETHKVSGVCDVGCDQGNRLRAPDLALAVLRRLARLLEPVLLTLLDPSVSGQEARPLQSRPVVVDVGLVERA